MPAFTFTLRSYDYDLLGMSADDVFRIRYVISPQQPHIQDTPHSFNPLEYALITRVLPGCVSTHCSWAIIHYNGVIIHYNGVIIHYNGVIIDYNGVIIDYSGEHHGSSPFTSNHPVRRH